MIEVLWKNLLQRNQNYGMKILENKIRNFWEKVFRNSEYKIQYQSWLADWQYLFPNSDNKKALDIGCGSGNDSVFMQKCGFKVTAFDFSFNALKQLSISHKNIFPVLADLNNGFPFKKNCFFMINASLSLHYFNFNKTKELIKSIAGFLTEDGVFFSRFNSANDFNHGATGVSNLRNVISEKEIVKMFFDKDGLEELFSSWHIIHLYERKIEYYKKEKIIWEVICNKLK